MKHLSLFYGLLLTPGSLAQKMNYFVPITSTKTLKELQTNENIEY